MGHGNIIDTLNSNSRKLEYFKFKKYLRISWFTKMSGESAVGKVVDRFVARLVLLRWTGKADDVAEVPG